MSRTYFEDFNLSDEDETEVTVEFSFRAGTSAITSGPPEHCDPGSPAEIELIKVWRKADENDPDAPLITLSEADAERIERWLHENFEEDDYADYDD